mgnify:CR=1 FL=1
MTQPLILQPPQCKEEQKMSEQPNVIIPAALYTELQAYLTGSVFASIDDLVAYVLQDFLERQNKTSNPPSEENQKIIEDRLKNLGYL